MPDFLQDPTEIIQKKPTYNNVHHFVNSPLCPFGKGLDSTGQKRRLRFPPPSGNTEEGSLMKIVYIGTGDALAEALAERMG